MRQIVTLAGVIAAAGAAYGQAFSEDFEGGIPGSWTVIDNEGTGVVWDTNVAWGDGNYTGGSGMSAAVNSDHAGTAEFDTELVTHAFTVPGGARLQLLANYQNFAALDFFDIDINNGSGWVNLLRWNEDHGGFDAPPGEAIDLDLSAYAGDTAQVRFHYYDPNSGDWDWYIQVDDVAVTPAPGALALLGIGGLAVARRRR
jgi:MYXO-CTERM domain-containing protein